MTLSSITMSRKCIINLTNRSHMPPSLPSLAIQALFALHVPFPQHTHPSPCTASILCSVCTVAFVMLHRLHPLGHVCWGGWSLMICPDCVLMRLSQWLHHSADMGFSVTACAVNTTSDSSDPASANLIWQATVRSSPPAWPALARGLTFYVWVCSVL